MNIIYNYNKLLGQIKEKNLTQETLAKKIRIQPTTLSQKLNNKAYFKQIEISHICKLLEIPDTEIGIYFFTH